MSRNKSSSAFSQGLKKFFLSAFVVFAFIAYAIHERLTNSNAGLSSASAAPTAARVRTRPLRLPALRPPIHRQAILLLIPQRRLPRRLRPHPAQAVTKTELIPDQRLM